LRVGGLERLTERLLLLCIIPRIGKHCLQFQIR
jgi:hypothetical protein